MKQKLKIIHTPEAVAGNASVLAEAERQLGHDSRLYYWRKTPYDLTLSADRKLPGGLLVFFTKLYVFFIALTADVIHFNNGSTLCPTRKVIFPGESFAKKATKILWNWLAGPFELLDLKILCQLGKKVLITFQGSDGRIHSFHQKHFKVTHAREMDVGREKHLDEFKMKLQKKMADTGAKIFSVNPDLLHTLPPGACFSPYSCVNIEEWNFISDPMNKVPVFLHAPSNPTVKGTSHVLQAVEDLKKAGYQFQFKLITGIPREKVKEFYGQADLVIDQLLVGWYGGLAVEAMALGIPVASFVREEDLKFIPKEMRDEMPILKAEPANLREILIYFLTLSQPQRLHLRSVSRRYVEKWHNPKTIAGNLSHFIKTPYSN